MNQQSQQTLDVYDQYAQKIRTKFRWENNQSSKRANVQSQSAINTPRMHLKLSKGSSRDSAIHINQSNLDISIKVIKPHRYPKKIYVRDQNDYTQQLVQHANGGAMYETSHKNLYGTPQFKEPSLPLKLIESQEDQLSQQLN